MIPMNVLLITCYKQVSIQADSSSPIWNVIRTDKLEGVIEIFILNVPKLKKFQVVLKFELLRCLFWSALLYVMK